jgi:hypothetical protein
MVKLIMSQQRFHWPIWLTIVILLALIYPIPIFSQEPKPPQSGKADDIPEVDCGILRTDVVIIEIEVKDKHETFVPFLTQTDFVIYEDGVKQTIAYFKQVKESDTGAVRYKVGYYPTNRRWSGEYRDIRVKMRGSRKLGLRVIYHPTGYFAPQE